MTSNDLFLASSGAISGYFWLLLAISGYFCLFLAIYSYFWLFLSISAYIRLLFILRWSCSCLFQGNFAVVGVIWQGKLAHSKGTFQKGFPVSRFNLEILSILIQIHGFAGVLRVYFAVYFCKYYPGSKSQGEKVYRRTIKSYSTNFLKYLSKIWHLSALCAGANVDQGGPEAKARSDENTQDRKSIKAMILVYLGEMWTSWCALD